MKRALGSKGAALACLLAGAVPGGAHAQALVVAHPSTPIQVQAGPGGRVVVTPSTAQDGVSYNGFSRFDVGAAGLTFANDAVRARTIVAEVLSAAPSHIEGPLDVTGPRANLILANQNGIRVNGGSFFNFGSVALTTGAVSLRDEIQPSGHSQRYVDVKTTQGQLLIDSQGVSGNLIRLEMMAKTVGIQGAVTNSFSSSTATVRIVAGESLAQFDTAASPVDNLTPWVHYTPGKASSSALALNLSADSKVTSGRIEILVTDQGAGVRNGGQLAASAGDFQLTSTGRLEQIGGQIQAQGQIHVQADEMELRNTPERSSLVAAGTNTILEAKGSLRNIGGEISGQNRSTDEGDGRYAVLLRAGGAIEHSTPVGAAKTALIFGRNDAVGLFAGADVSSVDARIVSNGALTVQTPGAVRNETLHVAGSGNTDWTSRSLFKRRSGYQVDMGTLADTANQAYWVAQGDLAVSGSSFANLGGYLFSNGGKVDIAATGDVTIQAHSIGQFAYRQSCFLFICKRTASSSESLVGGQIMAADTLNVRAGGQILNDAGQVFGGRGMVLQAPVITARARPVHTVISRDRGLKAVLGDTWAQVYATDQGGSFTVQQGRMVLQGAARQEGGVFTASEGVEGAIEVVRPPHRDPVRLENHLGLFW
ncbi:filamentous hemagglutinin N-terminal domain-containing protein [Paracidovorax valerianellae]|uniref:filamentous hemagglutinin N-terminal domain-containing protein n=1 Tax=Paracidovorax valerianellae TaxID=187868 RepID=UPI002304C501|nr:filamentous hemagglutinin N-terminal domain-containing protein [Paracidovorax valerianellae]MDA8443616.1 filamentous hemagglutinin N-terminal domain-containing protein [Paracidovorax valerianellae]